MTEVEIYNEVRRMRKDNPGITGKEMAEKLGVKNTYGEASVVEIRRLYSLGAIKAKG